MQVAMASQKPSGVEVAQAGGYHPTQVAVIADFFVFECLRRAAAFVFSFSAFVFSLC